MLNNMNQTPEQRARDKARDKVDAMLRQAGWAVQDKDKINFNASLGVAVREYQTDAGPADYVLFLDREPAGVVEAKREEEGHRLTAHEEQAGYYASSKLEYFNNRPLPFVYESTGEVTRFTDTRDPKPRLRPVFSFHRPETFE
jgi:type I restriction enzyme R subunit